MDEAIRHQVFVSSTFTDLQEARAKVHRVLLEMNCIPAGMELFPAVDEEQFEFIKKVIDDCDYYVLIIAGRYGSLTEQGVSYTEKEYDYALVKGLPVLAFLHSDPDGIAVRKSEPDQKLRRKLLDFREKVSRGRLVRQWSNADELAKEVVLSLTAALKAHPRPGWVRGPRVDTTGLLSQLNDLRQQNDQLRAKMASLDATALIPDLARPSEQFSINLLNSFGGVKAELTWDQILFHVGPDLAQWVIDESVRSNLSKALSREYASGIRSEVPEETFKTIRLQLIAFGWVTVESHNTVGAGPYLFWRLTAAGQRRLLQVRTIKTNVGDKSQGQSQ